MKCSACGASWDETTVSKKLLACPFCGEVLEKKKPKTTRKKKKKDKSLKDVLQEIIGLKGETILEDRDVTIGLISDLAPKMTKERRQLGFLYDIGAIKTILAGCHKTKTEQQRVCKKIGKQLTTDLDMEEDAAVILAEEVCTAIFGRKMSARSKNSGNAIDGAQSVQKKNDDTGSSDRKTQREMPENKNQEPSPAPIQKKTTKPVAKQQSSGSSLNPAASSVPAGQTTSGTKPVISHNKTTKASQRSVLAGASMVKSQQTLQQAALPPNNQNASGSGSGTKSKSGSGTSGRGRKKSSSSKSTSSRKSATAAAQTAQTYTYQQSGNNQSTWQPTPQQLQAYQYYTGKPYPQSAVPQSSGYQPWAPSYQPQQQNTRQSASNRTQPQNGRSSAYNQQKSGQSSFRSRLNNNAASTGGYSQSSVSTWLQPAMNGDKGAMYQLGLQYLRGTDGIVQDTNEGLKWITGAANKGEENAQFMLGYLYYSGTEIPKNESEALKWFLKCVRPRDFEVQYIIGMIYAYGTTITPNYAEAFKWFYRSAKGGNVQAQFIMGEFYHNGYDMEVNDKEAANWYAKAAKGGHTKAQQMLDYLNGGGTQSVSTAMSYSQTSQFSQAVQQAVKQTVQQVRQQQNIAAPRQRTVASQLPQQTQSWLNQSSGRQRQSQSSWQRQINADPDQSATRSPGWRQNQNIGVVSSNHSYQTLPSESQYTLGQSYQSKVNRKLLQDDEDDDWLNLSRKRGFSGSQT